jgi:lipid kinase YegS
LALKLPWRRRPKPGSIQRGQRLRVILHAKAAMRESVRVAVERLREHGHDIEVRVTWEAGDAEEFAHDAARDYRFKTVVAAGGDGTVNAVVSGLMASGESHLPSLAILPMGTANDFARACSIPADQALAALELAVNECATPVDVGLVNDRYFLNVATGGFGTDITVNTPNELKKVLGGAAYLLTGLSQPSSISARQASIEGPDFSWRGGFLALAVGNGRFAGGGVPMCEHALINNGKFELSILPEITYDDVPDVLANLLDFGFGSEVVEAHMVRAQAHEFTVRSETPLQINLDGEPLQSRSFHFEVISQSLRLHLPANTDIVLR